MGRLNGRNRATLRAGDLDQLPRAGLGAATHIQMIAHKKQERIAPRETAGARDSMTVAARFALFEELQAVAQRSRRRGIGRLVARTHHHANVLDAGGEHLLDQDAQRGLLHPVPIHQRLQRQHPLLRTGGRDDRSLNFHSV